MSRLLTPEEVGQRLRKTEHTLGVWRRTGGGPPFVRLGGANAVLYDEKDVEDWLDAQKVQSIQEERARGRTYNGAVGQGGS